MSDDEQLTIINYVALTTFIDTAQSLVDLWAEGEAKGGEHDLDELDHWMVRLRQAIPISREKATS